MTPRIRTWAPRGVSFALAMLAAQAVWAQQAIEVYKSASCGCCVAWGEILRTEGYQITETNLALADLMARKSALGLREGQTSCHTATIAGYVIEGHVPVREIRRLLAEKPAAIGLAVPDMPYGSPGMGELGDNADPYEVLLILRDGTNRIYAAYP